MKKCLSLILIVSILIYSYGCYSYKDVQKENLNSEYKIDSLVLLDGKTIQFDLQGARYDSVNMEIVGLTRDNIYMKIPYDQVSYVNVKSFNASRTTLLIISFPAALLLILLISLLVDPPNIWEGARK
jgi:hypothetical protein